jgi:hypothetical protein
MAKHVINTLLAPSERDGFDAEQTEWSQRIIKNLEWCGEVGDFTHGPQFWFRRLTTGLDRLKYKPTIEQRNAMFKAVWGLFIASSADVKFGASAAGVLQRLCQYDQPPPICLCVDM